MFLSYVGLKVAMANWNTSIIRCLYLSGMWLGVDLEVDTTIHVFERDRTMCPKYVKRSRFIGQHDLGRGHGWGPYRLLKEHKDV